MDPYFAKRGDAGECGADLGRSDLGPASGHRPALASSYEYLKLVEEKGQVGFWAWDFESGKQQWSLGMCRIVGFEPGCFEPTTELFTSLIHPPDPDARTERLHDVLQHGVLPDIEYRIIRPDHSFRWILCRGNVQLSRIGRPERAIGAIFDITTLKEAIEAEQRAASRYRALASATSSMIWTAASDGSLVEAASWRALTGQTLKEFQGSGWLQAVHPNDRERAYAQWQKAVQEQTIYHATYRVRYESGGYQWFQSRAAPVRDRTGYITEWIGVLLNPTDTTFLAEVGSGATATGAQIRAARGLLRWSEADLSQAAAVSRSTVRRAEEVDDIPSISADMLRAICSALQSAGVHFTFPPDGKPGIQPA